MAITVTMAMLRTALQSFGNNGQEISNAQLYAALELKNETEKARMRSRIAHMVEHGEVARTRDGFYVYNYKNRPRDAKNLVILWRFIRKARQGWNLQDCAMMTRVSYTQTLRYVSWLEGEKFVARIGKNNRNAILYRATPKADATPETPYPPLRAADPFQKERVAAATITRLLLCADPYAIKTAREVTEACRTLLARFGKDEHVTKNENEKTEVIPMLSEKLHSVDKALDRLVQGLAGEQADLAQLCQNNVRAAAEQAEHLEGGMCILDAFGIERSPAAPSTSSEAI